MVIEGGEFPGGVETGYRYFSAGIKKIVENLPEFNPYVDIVGDKMKIVNQESRRIFKTLTQSGSLPRSFTPRTRGQGR